MWRAARFDEIVEVQFAGLGEQLLVALLDPAEDVEERQVANHVASCASPRLQHFEIGVAGLDVVEERRQQPRQQRDLRLRKKREHLLARHRHKGHSVGFELLLQR